MEFPPSLSTVISEVLAEETRLATMKSQGNLPSDHLVDMISSSATLGAATSSSTSSTSSNSYKKIVCRYCKKAGHVLSECHKLKAKQAASSGQSNQRNLVHGSKPVTAAAT